MRTLVRKKRTAMLHISLPIGLIMLIPGCAAKHRPEIDVIVPIAAITKPVILKDCDLSTDPPKCKHAQITYKKSQAIVSAK